MYVCKSVGILFSCYDFSPKSVFAVVSVRLSDLELCGF